MKIIKLLKIMPIVFKRALIRLSLKKNISYLWLGNNHAGFYVNIENLNKNSIVYSFGIGEDISFDAEIIKRTHANVYGFDPTPKSIKWIKNNSIKNFIPHDYGIGIKDELTKLYLPKNSEHVSGSIINNYNFSDNYIKIKVKKLKTIMNDLGHNKIDVLKLDIEGLEYDVLKNILSENLLINQILVEFHDRFFVNRNTKRKEMLNLLKKKGFILFAISKSLEEYSFIKIDLYNQLKKKT